MADEIHMLEAVEGPKKRRLGKKKGSKMKKKPKKGFQLPGRDGELKPKKMDRKMKKLFRKRAREYNSDEEEESEPEPAKEAEEDDSNSEKIIFGGNSFEDAEGKDGVGDSGFSDDEEDDEIQPGITKFTEGCRAFRMAFKSIIKKSVQDEPLGPVLSAHKKLIAEKLAEDETERKVKREAKKEKHLVGEKGHVKPATYLDSHEKFLIGVATKGVVKLFNAVNKAQNAQKGLNPSNFKDAKAIRKRRKEAFFSELDKKPSAAANTTAKVRGSSSQADGEGPAWAPLRDNYMLTDSKLKDWDKMPDTAVTDDVGRVSEDSSSDDD